MSKHTPGPWRYEATRRPNGGFNIIQEYPRGNVVVKPGDEYNCYGNIDSEEDARLISAAPELLSALMDLVDGYSVGGTKRAREIIAKATGAA